MPELHECQNCHQLFTKHELRYNQIHGEWKYLCLKCRTEAKEAKK